MTIRGWAAGACTSAALLGSGAALAAGPPSHPTSKPECILIELEPDAPPPGPEPPPPKPPARPQPAPLHSGLYLRIAAGPSYLMSLFEIYDKAQRADLAMARFSGGGSNLEARLGFAIARRVAFGLRGGALLLHTWRFGDIAAGDVDATTPALGSAGWFIDLYPFADNGFHASLSPAVNWLRLPDPTGAIGDYRELLGVSFSASAGYEGRLAEAWGLGVQARLDGGILSHGARSDPVTSGAAWISPGVQLTATYF